MNSITTTVEIPVIFFDGEREIDLGKLKITPNLITFKILQSTLSNKIGISPNQITIYFDPTNRQINHRSRRRPVTSKFDFSVLHFGHCFLWVVLKRSRRSRRHRNNHNNIDWEYLEYVNRMSAYYMMSLNMNSNVYQELSNHYYYNNNYNNENYSDDYYGDEMRSSSSPGTSPSTSTSASDKGGVYYCEVCCNFGGDAVVPPFHWCKNDAVTPGFRSIVGPIAPPSPKMKKS